MRFCSQCQNMYYLKLGGQDDDSLMFYCRVCGHEIACSKDEDAFTLTTLVNKQDKSYLRAVNRYTKLDPTLPRTSTIKCPNQECSKVKETDKTRDGNSVIYLRSDNERLTYTYLCTHCDTVWESNSSL